MTDDVARGDGFERFPWRPSEPTFSKWKAIAVGVVAGMVGVLLAAQAVSTGEWLELGLGFVLSSFFALIGFGLMPQASPRGGFRYINAIVMTRAERPTADSWVHLAPTRGVRLPMLLGWLEGALAMSATAVYALLVAIGIAPVLNEDTSRGGYLLACIPLALIAVFCWWISILLIGRRVRGGSFGTRPSGVALGETGLAVNVPGREVEIPWSQVTSVTAQRIGGNGRHERLPLLPHRRRRGENIDIIRLALHPGGEVTEREQLLSATGYSVPTDALYSALRWYLARPDARWELGRVEGERRLDGWRRRAIADESAVDGACDDTSGKSSDDAACGAAGSKSGTGIR